MGKSRADEKKEILLSFLSRSSSGEVSVGQSQEEECFITAKTCSVIARAFAGQFF